MCEILKNSWSSLDNPLSSSSLSFFFILNVLRSWWRNTICHIPGLKLLLKKRTKKKGPFKTGINVYRFDLKWPFQWQSCFLHFHTFQEAIKATGGVDVSSGIASINIVDLNPSHFPVPVFHIPNLDNPKIPPKIYIPNSRRAKELQLPL